MANSNLEQSLANHARTDPWFHYFTMPVFAVNVIVSLVRAIRDPTIYQFWLLVVSFAALMVVFLFRIYSMKVQDRVIRLEERLRLSMVAPEPLRSRVGELTVGQLIALRFASNEEVAGLMEKALNENLSAKQIKRSVKVWRADFHRV